MSSLPPPGDGGGLPPALMNDDPNLVDFNANAPPKNPLSLGIGFLKGLGNDRKVNRDGQQPKRRGPKPDSKPALTRRQELNRQAQRTHRERKEGYIKALEEQVMRLREIYSTSAQERNAVIDENRRLKELLQMHGIPYPESGVGGSGGGRLGSHDAAAGFDFGPGPSPPASGTHSQPTTPGTFGGSGTGSDTYMPLASQQRGAPAHPPPPPATGALPNPLRPAAPAPQPDYDQLGVDFVLALERACMDHLHDMLQRSSSAAQPTPSGHALMVSCPPPMPTGAFVPQPPPVPTTNDYHQHQHGHGHEPAGGVPVQDLGPVDARPPLYRPALPSADLVRLFKLSQHIPTLDGEMTPIMALNHIWRHPRARELSPTDWAFVRDELSTKTRCYGFGAVLEEFELNDALQAVFQAKELTQLASGAAGM